MAPSIEGFMIGFMATAAIILIPYGWLMWFTRRRR